MNQILLLGRLTREPELRYTKDGTAVTRFNIAVKRDQNDKVDFINCLTFGKAAEATAQYCNKGRQIMIVGRLEINSTQNQQNNQLEYFTQIVVNKIEFLAQPKGHQQLQQTKEPIETTQNNIQKQRFEPGPNGWQNPSDQEAPF